MQSRPSTLWLAAALALGMVATAHAAATRDQASSASEAAQGVPMVPTGKGYGAPAAGQFAPEVKSALANGIDYHGGPVMSAKGGQNIYIIWYGDWATQSPTGKAIITDMLKNITGTPYHNINTTYYQNNKPGKNVKNKVNLKTQIDDAGKSLGSALSDDQIKQLVQGAITGGKFPSDKNGIYLVLTTKDVNATSGFCSLYCGWHDHASISGVDIKYSFVGDAARCLSSCAEQSASSPNDNPGVDGMASVIMHEIEEAATDPDLNAWYETSTGMENADKCAWTFGAQQTAPNGSKYNVQWGPRKFLIQQNWVNANGGKCAMQYP
ncbi:hypothetical protein AACH06_22310 [Ideonella sp. DXS29W]|uniref:Uncharacterized protein n=1 Tax=Ideonella lacteola TaxID=2984193 RepID=A0ABU9BUB7_9BURK